VDFLYQVLEAPHLLLGVVFRQIYQEIQKLEIGLLDQHIHKYMARQHISILIGH
jgi:hypothetical protein